jgi:hypothetical protein
MAERSIADVARALQRYGKIDEKTLNIGEHPEFGGVGSGHSPTGYHPVGQAIDVRDWRPDVAPAYKGGKPIPWKQRTGELRWRAKQLGIFDEVLGPGDPGHDTHVHLALAGRKFITEPQLEWLTTGRHTVGGKLVAEMPTVSTPVSSENPGSANTQAAAANLFGSLINALQPKEKPLQQQLMESAMASAFAPRKSNIPALMQYVDSGPLNEIIYG